MSDDLIALEKEKDALLAKAKNDLTALKTGLTEEELIRLTQITARLRANKSIAAKPKVRRGGPTAADLA